MEDEQLHEDKFSALPCVRRRLCEQNKIIKLGTHRGPDDGLCPSGSLAALDGVCPQGTCMIRTYFT